MPKVEPRFPVVAFEESVVRVLDLGCGTGRDLAPWGVVATDVVTGIDIDDQRLQVARERFPRRTFLHGAGERIPASDESFEMVIAGVSLPYMNIQQALREIRRVLIPGGCLLLSLHLPSFAFAELIHRAIPSPVSTLYRLYVLSNGLLFHSTGRTMGFVRGRTESFQTERGMKIALRNAGFEPPSFRRGTGPAGETFMVETRKPLTATAHAAA